LKIRRRSIYGAFPVDHHQEQVSQSKVDVALCCRPAPPAQTTGLAEGALVHLGPAPSLQLLAVLSVRDLPLDQTANALVERG
ncbi:hypothetical protein C1T15_28490, partial [Escherichia coli]